YNGGNSHKFQFAAPEVKVNSNPSGTENPKLVKFKLKYKTVGLTTWSEVDGLVFTANTADKEYEFRIKATDRAGNSVIYELTEKDHVKITFRDVTPPKINVSWFKSERYLDQAVSLPSASATDDLDSSPKTSVKVYYIMDEKGQPVYEKDEEGNIVYEDEEPKKVLVSESTSFTPDKVGWYEVIYTAEDREGHVTASPPYTFKVVKASDTPKEPIIDLSNTWNIVFLSIAGVCALGLIIIPFIKPKEE
ncbi:MAG: fibronectin type III domain-containing protein, partial [Clostridiales bacterium]|nr:fibronectin type III domain-containing protein [Clostridiales bacterium]